MVLFSQICTTITTKLTYSVVSKWSPCIKFSLQVHQQSFPGHFTRYQEWNAFLKILITKNGKEDLPFNGHLDVKSWLESKNAPHGFNLLLIFSLTCQFQVFPQTFEGQYPYYQGPPGPPVPQGPTVPNLTQAPYQGTYYGSPSSPANPWESLKTYSDTAKQPGRVVFPTKVGPCCGSMLVLGNWWLFWGVCFFSSVVDGAEPPWRQQWWWPHTVLPVSVFRNIVLLLPLESAGTMFLSVLMVVGNGNRKKTPPSAGLSKICFNVFRS